MILFCCKQEPIILSSLPQNKPTVINVINITPDQIRTQVLEIVYVSHSNDAPSAGFIQNGFFMQTHFS